MTVHLRDRTAPHGMFILVGVLVMVMIMVLIYGGVKGIKGLM